MYDATAMGLVERVANLRSEFQDLIERQGSLFEAFGQRLPLKTLHNDVVDSVLIADVVQDADVRMV